MAKISTISFCEPFLDRLVDHIESEYLKKGKDLSRLAIVFGGKRPALFIKKKLAVRIKTNFFPPHFFTIDEFINYVIAQKEQVSPAKDLDHCYLIYSLAKEYVPEILKGRETFAQFLPWTHELLNFIDQLDLEKVDDDKLRNIEANAQIGYPVPEDINRLLKSIVRLRQVYHQAMIKEKVYSRGFQYLKAAELIDQINFDQFDEILFCNFFYFNRSEEALIKNLYDRKKARLIFQGDERKWPILKRIARNFNCEIKEGEKVDTPNFSLKLYSAFDAHSQVGTVREILKSIKHPENSVIVLPQSDNIVPLLSEITQVAKDFNISMGYPLKRSSLYSLFEFIFKAQSSRKDARYYSKDYLRVIRHPFIKNLVLHSDATLTRTLVHKIEDIMTGKEKAPISGKLFLELEDIFNCDELYMLTLKMLDHLGVSSNREELQSILEQIHELAFFDWEQIKTFESFSKVLGITLEVLMEKSFLKNYPLNLNIAVKMLEIKEEMEGVTFKKEIFPQEDIFRIFESKINHEIVAFKGSPLKGLQILGLFETRSLNFENVIVMDLNEGTLPKLTIYEPLIPREVMISLNLDRMELEEEIQRYQFMRLISSAKNVFLVYQEGKDKEKSRFVEELIWEEEKKGETTSIVPVNYANFEVKVSDKKRSVQKTPEMVSFLRDFRYSASSINTYVRNPMEFYFKYVLGLEEKEDILDEPEARHVGTFIHELLEHSFYPFLQKKPKIDSAFRQRFNRMFEERFQESFGASMKSDAFLLKSVLEERLKRFLDNEETNEDRQVEEILYLESRFEDRIDLPVGEIKLKYIVDRVDKLSNGTIMIIDYKTGSLEQMPRAIEEISTMALSREKILDKISSFQIPLYFHYLNKQFPSLPINAALYNLRTLELHKFINERTSHAKEEIVDAFMKPLNFIMAEIFDPNIPFIEDLENA